MHHIYHTEGVVLASKSRKEADKLLYIFTRDLGMVIASASGLRKASSKLRFVLQDYSHVNVDLVRGKDLWRVTSASKIENGINFSVRHPAFPIFANISRLLKKLLTGEEPSPSLYDEFTFGILRLFGLDLKQDLSNMEAVLVLRLLNHLGYVSPSKDTAGLIHSPLEGEVLSMISLQKNKVLKEINRAIKETGL